MKVRRRVYVVNSLEVDGVKLPILKLKESNEVTINVKKSSGDAFDALSDALYRELIEMEEKGAGSEGVYVEYVAKSGKLVVRVGGGKGLKGEMAKWPAKLKRVAVLKESPKEVDLNGLKWVEVGEDVYVYEGKPSGQYKAILLDTEDGMYVLLSEKALEEEVKEWEFEEEGANEGEKQQGV